MNGSNRQLTLVGMRSDIDNKINMSEIKVVIDGVGSCIPDTIVKNEDFLNAEFYQENGERFEAENSVIIQKFESITGIKERRYATADQTTSDLAAIAAEKALSKSSIDAEELDYIIMAHNFGDMKYGSNRSDFMPSLAARVKHALGIKNPKTSCFDVIFGCPGWLQGAIQATQIIKSGEAKNIMVIGGETISRIVDVYDRNCMIFSDGAGATIFSAASPNIEGGVLSQSSRTDAEAELNYLAMGPSYNPSKANGDLFIKMLGRKIYEYALLTVAGGIKEAMDKAGVSLGDVSKILIHQANEKMDEAILKKLFKLCGVKRDMNDIMPMTIQTLGNSSVATIPTMLDLILENKLEGHQINTGDVIVFASVGAGMHINAMVYKMP